MKCIDYLLFQTCAKYEGATPVESRRNKSGRFDVYVIVAYSWELYLLKVFAFV